MKIDDLIEKLQQEKEKGKTDIVLALANGWADDEIKFVYHSNKSMYKNITGIKAF